MKKYNYKIVLYARGTYREYSLSDKFHQKLTIGTLQTSDVRFNQKEYPNKFEVRFTREGNVWSLECEGEIGLAKKEKAKEKKGIEHGYSDTFITEDGRILFSFTFIMEYPDSHAEYDSYMDIKGREKVTVGDSKEADVFIPELEGDYFRIARNAKGIFILNNSKNGIYINGFPRFEDNISIRNYEFIMMDGYEFYLDGDKLYYSLMENLDIRINKERVISRKEYPHFVRNTRILTVVPEEKIMVLSPKPKMDHEKRSILFTIIPTLFAMVIMFIMRSMMGRSGLFAIYGAVTMGIGVITSVITHIADGKDERKQEQQRRESYMNYISSREDYIREMRKKELSIRNKKYISLKECIEQVNLFDSKLFEKNKKDDDFLTVRLGKGKIPASCAIEFKVEDFKDTSDELMDYPAMLAQTYKYLNDAPVCVDLKELNGLGVVGNSVQTYELLKVITFDLATRHHYKDVRFVYFFEDGEEDRHQWLRWLKNVEFAGKREFVYDEESRKHILESLYEQFSFRETLKKEELQNFPNIVVFVQGDQNFEKHPIINYIDRCNDFGFTFIFFNETKEKLPVGCDYIVTTKTAGEAALINAHDSEDVIDFEYETIPDKTASDLALRLGGIYVDEISLESGLVKNITLYELLDIVNADNLNLERRWGESKIYESMAAALGVDSSDQIVTLDLHEKYHGPHGLVAGTTGSGKSEILLSYILSMATMFHPHEVGFVIIDFKGGGMVNQLANLPHLIGAITNIDGDEIQRSLMSIQAELRKRQQLFAEQQVNHIDAYIKKYKEGVAKTALPHLILIVDEFAELKSSQPEFMNELISTARIGRSLGVHLILATQKPSGVVNEQIWSNSKFKLCLKVQNKTDSNDVIKSPLAAEIREPGRAYLQVGNNEIFKLFQSAYSGASSVINDVGTIKEYTVYEKALSGECDVIFQQKASKKKDDKAPTQLEAVVDYIADYCVENNIDRLPGICLPMIGDVVEYEDNAEDNKDFTIAIGLYDDPANQYQGVYRLNVCQENTFILGASQYGKTNLLQLMIKQLAEHYSPSEVQMYILDFASATLKIYESLKHVGGVVLAAEDEKMENFFKLMNEQLEKRKEKLSDMGLGSFSAYKEAGGTEFANIVIFIDNLTAMRELYLMENDQMLRIIREGLSVGITVVVANGQSSGVPYKYLSNFSNRISLYCNEKTEYSFLFDRVSATLEDIPGRAFVRKEKQLMKAQIYLTSKEEREIDRVNSTRKMIEEVNARCETRALRIPVVPKILTWNNYVSDYLPNIALPGFAPGLNFDNVEPLFMRVQLLNMLCVVGMDAEMTESYVLYALQYIKECMRIGISTIYTFGRTMDSVSNMVGENVNIIHTDTVDGCEEVVASFEEALEQGTFETNPIAIIFNEEEFGKKLSANKDLDKRFVEVLEKIGKMKKNFVIYNQFPNERISRMSPQLLQLMKDQGGVVCFDEVEEIKVQDIMPSVSRKYKKKLLKWEAYYLEGANLAKIKTVKVK